MDSRRGARTATLLAAALALAALYAGVHWGALVAGGSDSYGYVSQAGLWQRGLPIVQQDIVRPSPWPVAAETWAPLGYRPSPKQPGAIVPMYAPGLPLLMALLQMVAGYCGAFLVVPLCGALTIWLTYLLGRRLFDAPGIALWGASLVATSPTFLYQLMNAMSDVPVTAMWTLALVLAVQRRPLASGLAMAVAVAIRPNLAALALVLVAWMAMESARTTIRSPKSEVRSQHSGVWILRGFSHFRLPTSDFRLALSGCWWFVIGVTPAIVGIAWVNGQLYESPLTSGYGTTGDLYGLTFLPTNVRQFATWMAQVETPIVALSALYFAAPRLFPPARIPFARLLLGGSLALVILSYIFYRPFDAWWYLRFLLPMWPPLMLLTAAALDALARRWLRPVQPIAIAAAAAFLAWHGVCTAARRSAFDLGRGERRYVDVGRFIANYTDADAVIFALQHSGSLRIYGGRLTLKYEVLDPAWLDRTVEYLQSIGRRPYFVLDGDEREAFKQRFGAASRFGALDWPPLATLGTIVSVYDPIDQRPGSRPMSIVRTSSPRGAWLCDPPYLWPPALRLK